MCGFDPVMTFSGIFAPPLGGASDRLAFYLRSIDRKTA